MRILIVHPGPEFSVADVFDGWAKAFTALGHEVAVYNTNDRLSFYGRVELPDLDKETEACGHRPMKRAMDDDQALAAGMQGLSHACYTFWPDLVFFVSAFFTKAVHLQLIRSRHHKIVMLHTESPYQDDEQLQRAQFADYNLLNDPVNLAAYKALAPARYMAHAYDPDKHRRSYSKDPDYTSEFAFIGTAFQSRVEFFERMNFEGINTCLGGSGWDNHPDSPLLQYLGHDPGECVPNSETIKVYQNGKVGINFYRRESENSHEGEGWAMGPREIEMAACGLPFLRDPRPEGDEILHMLPRYSSPEEASDQLRWLLTHETARQEMANQAYEAIKDRTFLNNAKELMADLDHWGIISLDSSHGLSRTLGRE